MWVSWWADARFLSENKGFANLRLIIGCVTVNDRSMQSRNSFLRLYTIVRMLLSHKCPSAGALAERFEVSRKTINRDMEFLRDQWGLEIEYDSGQRGYLLRKEVSGVAVLAFVGCSRHSALITMMRTERPDTSLRTGDGAGSRPDRLPRSGPGMSLAPPRP